MDIRLRQENQYKSIDSKLFVRFPFVSSLHCRIVYNRRKIQCTCRSDSLCKLFYNRQYFCVTWNQFSATISQNKRSAACFDFIIHFDFYRSIYVPFSPGTGEYVFDLNVFCRVDNRIVNDRNQELEKYCIGREFVMDILIEIIAEFFTVLFGSQANKLGADREVPKWVKILFLILAVAFIAGILYLCWRLSE